MKRPAWLGRIGRVEGLTGVGLVLLLGLSGRLYALGVHRHAELRKSAERRSRRVEILPVPRGGVFDRLACPWRSIGRFAK